MTIFRFDKEPFESENIIGGTEELFYYLASRDFTDEEIKSITDWSQVACLNDEYIAPTYSIRMIELDIALTSC